MKIILTAFENKLTSKPIDVPENTTERWKMRLHKPLTAITDYNGEHLCNRESFESECEFEFTGKIMEGGIMVYELVDIFKLK